jgi:hypothetical protein
MTDNLSINRCGPNAVSQVLYTEEIKNLDQNDVLLFIPDSGPIICMSKKELLDYWSFDSSWNWGNCQDINGNPIDDTIIQLGEQSVAAQYCNKYYKVPATNQYLTDAMKDRLTNSNTQVWTISDSGEKRVIGRGIHYSGEYNNQNEEIYKICPENEQCNFIEDSINRSDISIQQDTTLTQHLNQMSRRNKCVFHENISDDMHGNKYLAFTTYISNMSDEEISKIIDMVYQDIFLDNNKNNQEFTDLYKPGSTPWREYVTYLMDEDEETFDKLYGDVLDKVSEETIGVILEDLSTLTNARSLLLFFKEWSQYSIEINSLLDTPMLIELQEGYLKRYIKTYDNMLLGDYFVAYPWNTSRLSDSLGVISYDLNTSEKIPELYVEGTSSDLPEWLYNEMIRNGYSCEGIYEKFTSYLDEPGTSS